MVDFLMYGSDERQKALARLLQAEYTVQTAAAGADKAAAVVLPIPSAWPDGMLRGASWDALEPQLRAGVTVYGGAFGALREAIEQTGARCVDLLADETAAAENARLTAEAALVLVMEHTKQSLFGTPCCVIGFGRIGTALSKLLAGLGAEVTVISPREEKRALAAALGFAAAAPEQLAAQTPRFVFNTAPAQLVPGLALAALAPDTLWIELASAPGGLPAGAKLPFSRLPAGSLPARLLPVSAAEVLFHAIKRS